MSKNATLLLVLVFLTASFVITSLPVKAEPRTIVVPDDYPTIQEAINAANEGDTIFVKKGNYDGPIGQTVVINKTVSLVGEDAENTKINFHPLWVEAWFFTLPSYYETPMQITANDVMVSGLTITSDGSSISITGNRTRIAGCIIKTSLRVDAGFYNEITENALSGVSCHGSHCLIDANNFEAGGIDVGGSHNLVQGNVVTNAGNRATGISLEASNTIIFNNTVKRNYCGISVYDEGSNNLIYSNSIIHNVYGFVAWGGNNNTFFANDLVNNTCGVEVGYLGGSPTNCTLHHNNFFGSIQQVSTRSSQTYIPGLWSEPFNRTGLFDDGREGNYWSDYVGTDSDGDGKGDNPYVIDLDRKDNYPLMSPFDISSASISDAFPDIPDEHESEPFPITRIIALVVTAAVVAVGLLVYFEKRDQKKTEKSK
jgi:parallel beta-helix repeat protein